ncbi:hypothetical protein ACFPT7_03225 [Acidicapsa dinghuensis]|uniref:Uncharacterized protein n=1 Tax=Acidicapsa dinghuensis TaxID=2218256 RepID=A0ABW1EDK0_9BACT|nr:hypothetical protein [Acidicapsa dinghuensis]
MKPEEMGKRLGIGVRVAGRIAQQRAAASAQAKSHAVPNAPGPASQPAIYSPANSRKNGRAAGAATRNLGRGIGGFLRPFGRVGGILWLEVTGFFFGLFGLYFAIDIWRTRLSYAAGPQHTHFLIAVGMTVVFCYLCVSAFWRAQRK